MKGRMQETSVYANDCPKRDRMESEWIHGDDSRHELFLNGGSADLHVDDRRQWLGWLLSPWEYETSLP